MLESKFSILFRHWLKANPMMSCALEMKQTNSNSIPFSCVSDEQLDYGMAIRSDKGTLIRVIGQGGEPDYIYLRREPSFIVIKFADLFCVISVEKFIYEKEHSGRKSLTAEKAKSISIIYEKTNRKK